MISLAAIGIELKVRSNKGLTKKVTNHLYIYFSRRNYRRSSGCIKGDFSHLYFSQLRVEYPKEKK